MELTTTSQCVSYANLPKLAFNYYRPSLSSSSSSSINFLGFNCINRKLKCSAKQLKHFGAIHASVAQTNSTNASVTWILEFIGDGDTRHIGTPTAKPTSLEIPSGGVTVGRVADKADVVIPVPTGDLMKADFSFSCSIKNIKVSAVHARIQNTEEYIVVTDLDSTNGTFIGDKRLQPGLPAAALPGSLLTFGDTNLAIFRVVKLEKLETSASEPEETEASTKEEELSSS